MPVIEKFINGKPQFHCPPPVTGCSLLGENRQISKLKPSQRTENKVLIAIQKFFIDIFNWLFPFARTNYVGIVAAFDRSSEAQKINLSSLDQDQLLSYLQRFTRSDSACSKNLKQCAAQLQEQYQAIEKFKKATPSPPSDNKGQPQGPNQKQQAELEKLKKQFNGWVQSVENLKNQEQRLIVGQNTTGDELLYLFSRADGKITLKIIGRGASMAALSGVEEVAVAGKTKIVASVTFTNIDKELIRNLLDFSPLGSNKEKGASWNALLKNLGTHRLAESNLSENIATKTDQFFKLFWSAVKEINKNDGKQASDYQRLKLRAKTFTLFDLYKQYREGWGSQVIEVHTVERMLDICCHNYLKAHRLGTISKKEVENLLKEVKPIRKCIEEARRSAGPSISKITLPSMSQYEFGKPKFASPSSIPLPQPTNIIGRSPTPAPSSSQNTQTIIRKNSNPIRSSLPIAAELQALLDGATPHEIVRRIFNLEFQPYNDRDMINQSSPWVHFSKGQANEIMEKLYQLSMRLKDSIQETQEFPADVRTAIIKMSMMIGFLTPHTIQENVFSKASYSLLINLQNFIHNRDNKTWVGKSRFGQCLHSSNLKAHIEISNFYWNLLRYTNAAPSHIYLHPLAASELTQTIGGLEHLQKQIDLLHYLIPASPQSWLLHTSYPSDLQLIEPMPLPLLAAFHFLKVSQVGRWDTHNRDLPEAIHHDPQSSVEEYQNLLTKRISEWTSDATQDLKGRPSYASAWYIPQLKASPFTKEQKQHRIQQALKESEEYFFKASQLEGDFSKEEMTSLLSLLRSDSPQTEIIAFIEAHPTLLLQPGVRTFVELLFFHFSLFESLNHIGSDSYAPRSLFPNFFAEKIQFYKQKVDEGKAELLPILILLLQMSERLKEIYEVLDKKPNWFKTYSTSGFPVRDFFHINHSFIQSLPDSSDPTTQVGIVMLRLKYLLNKPGLSENEISQAILEMQRLKNSSNSNRKELFAIESSYSDLMNELIEKKFQFSQNPPRYLLDAICSEKGLCLDHSEWRGDFPCFENAQYKIDLVKGTLIETATGYTSASLPIALAMNPTFRKSFPDLKGKQVMAMMQKMADGTQIYFFNDSRGNPCRIEMGKEKEPLFYRTLPQVDGKLLQAVEKPSQPIFSLLGGTEEKKDLGFSDYLKLMFTGIKPPLPSILDQGIFVDPKMPNKGYVISPEGDLQLEVNFEKKGKEFKIKSVIDLRENQRSKPIRLTSLETLHHPALQQLKQIESPENILVWGNRNVEKIELPRYGLTFALKEGHLTCTAPDLLGYRLKTSASSAERKGFTHSLLLEHPDRSRPTKLLLPPVDSLVEGMTPPAPYRGLAYFIYMIKMIFSMLFTGNMPKGMNGTFSYHVDTQMKKINPVIVDLNSHTGELQYARGKEREHSQELIMHAVKLGLATTAQEIIRSLTIEEDFASIREWVSFIQALSKKEISEPIVLLLCEKINKVIGNAKIYEEYLQTLKQIEVPLFKNYLREIRKLPTSFQLSKETFKRLANFLHNEDPLYYQKHVTPYLLKEKEHFALPITYADGTISSLSPLKAIEVDPETSLSRIEQLEHDLDIAAPIDRNSLSKDFTLKKTPTYLLFTPDALSRYFSTDKRLTSETKLLREVVNPRLKAIEDEKNRAEQSLFGLLQHSQDPIDQLSIFAGEKRSPTRVELMIALLQRDFTGLIKEGCLPQNIDIKALESKLIEFYDLEVRFHLLHRCQQELNQMIEQKRTTPDLDWRNRSSLLFDLLTSGRLYVAEENPEFLMFEAFQFITFRSSTETNQLEYLQKLIKSPASIVQAGTGIGKTTVISVLRHLMRADGKNLVTQKVLPHLYQETVAILEERLGKTFKKKVYPFLFNQSMPIYDEKKNSLFQQIYQRMLQTIKDKGCVLTDYKSTVLLEQKFFAVSKQLLANLRDGMPHSSTQIDHWTYLRKILLLLQNREDALMDEFDQPMSAVQRIQTQLREGEKFASWQIDASLYLYDYLLQEPDLLLKKNLQGEIPNEMRKASIERIAQKVAADKAKAHATPDAIYRYLIGESEDLLNYLQHWSPQEKDTLAFLKDQLHIYLSSTLNESGISRYAFSPDGTKIVTCFLGLKMPAKFGNPIGEINYSIQSYYQLGIPYPVLFNWISNAKKEWLTHPADAQRRFAELLPQVDLSQLARLSKEEFKIRVEQFLEQLNQDPKAVRFFLERHLRALKSSGLVISMNPQDSVAMSLAVSGVSATAGSLNSLHDQFEKDQGAVAAIEEAAVNRIKQRSYGMPLRYDPLNPFAILDEVKQKKIPLTAIIDGNGAFHNHDPKKVAEALLSSNPSLKKVEYYDTEGEVRYVGKADTSIAEKGFYFPQAHTRGSDQQLKPDGIALHMTNSKGNLEDFIQQEGRMRSPRQQVLIALSCFAPQGMITLDDIIACKRENQTNARKEDRFKAEIQRRSQTLRHVARETLLQQSDLNHFLASFHYMDPLFIQTSIGDSDETNAPGTYFDRHKSHVLRNADPIAQLEGLQNRLTQDCQRLGLSTAALDNYDPERLRSEFPNCVIPIHATESQRYEVQQELEENHQLEQEQQLELAKEVKVSKVDSYPARSKNSDPRYRLNHQYPAFSEKITLNSPYFPVSRTDPLHKRSLFDERMARIGNIEVIVDDPYSGTPQIKEVIVGDLLNHTATHHQWPNKGFMYDIRLNRITSANSYYFSSPDRIINSPEFHSLIAQVKFLDGMTDGYTPEEARALENWLKAHSPAQMRELFTKVVQKNRVEPFQHTQLCRIFESLLASP
jgi:Protein of unknown function (DUF3638)